MYCSVLRYSAFIAPKSRPIDKAVRIKRTQKTKMVYNELFGMNSSETRDTLWWRIALINDVRTKFLKNCTYHSTQTLAISNFSIFSMARMVFRNLYWTPHSHETQTSLRFSGMFDAAVIDVVDLLEFIFKELKIDKRCIGENETEK